MKNIKFSFVFFIFSLITLISSVFAFFAITNVSNVGGIDSDIPDFNNMIKFEIQRNDDEFQVIKSIVDLEAYFLKTRPGEDYTFKITFNNHSNKNISYVLSFLNVRNDYTTNNGNSNYDIRDVFYIKDGKVNISNDDPYYYIVDETPVIKYNQELSPYRLSNLQTGNDIIVLPLREISAQTEIVITFTLSFDITTKDINYQSNILKFEGLYLYGQ